MNFEEICWVLFSQFGEEAFVVFNQKSNQPILKVSVDKLHEVCFFLNQDERLYFDYLACISGIDNGPESGTLEVVYHLTSIPYEHNLTLKVETTRQLDAKVACVPTLSDIWKSANWLERETYDLIGIQFEGHSDLRRILLPNDWQGFPLRKDYQAQESYHGIKVIY